ncbi:hypothetical protein M409DRAFT_30780 [Zasmidium cellare ATCC 36951]|uniref:Uncharacterized protein n=1 Tax=Zasmidium cellare ATCC 36951 TaxID=1080233 RepID=A0A6A6BW11_ZASCE|nr:uncharacterized protein M409DRAFT_30780 [Zasmidium cellare ATCC 36951]KAF2158753.1 hypothetical protein M409DRAFT_30780 [Zasmidium cellare ATCC 36951]
MFNEPLEGVNGILERPRQSESPYSEKHDIRTPDVQLSEVNTPAPLDELTAEEPVPVEVEIPTPWESWGTSVVKSKKKKKQGSSWE